MMVVVVMVVVWWWWWWWWSFAKAQRPKCTSLESFVTPRINRLHRIIPVDAKRSFAPQRCLSRGLYSQLLPALFLQVFFSLVSFRGSAAAGEIFSKFHWKHF